MRSLANLIAAVLAVALACTLAVADPSVSSAAAAASGSTGQALMAFPAGPDKAADEYIRQLPFARPLATPASVQGDLLVLDAPAKNVELSVPLVDLINPAYESLAANVDITVAAGGPVTVTALGETLSFVAAEGRGSYRVAFTQTQLASLEAALLVDIPATSFDLTLAAQTNITHIGRGTHIELRAKRDTPKAGNKPIVSYLVGAAPLGHDLVPMQIQAVHLNQSSQDISGTVPTVVGRPGLLRVFAPTTDPNAEITDVSAYATLIYPDQTVYTAALNGPSSLGSNIDARFRATTFDLTLDRARVQANMAVRIDMTMTFEGVVHTLRYPQHGYYEFVTVTMPSPTIKQIPIVLNNKVPELSADPYATSGYSSQVYKFHPVPAVALEILEGEAKTQAEVNEITGKNGADARVRYAKSRTDIWSREDFVFVYTIADTSTGLAAKNHVIGTAGTSRWTFGHEVGHNFGLGHDNDARGCPWRGSVAYNVLTDQVEGEMWPIRRHVSMNSYTPCAEPSLRYVDGQTAPAKQWGTVGTNQHIIDRYGTLSESSGASDPIAGDVDCSGTAGLADAMLLAQGIAGQPNASAECSAPGDGLGDCDTNSDEGCNRDDILELLRAGVSGR